MPNRILIVDDEPYVALTYARILAIGGYVTTEAHSYDEAVVALDKTIFDLAIVDYVMPGVRGDVLARYIRKQFPETAILMVSAMPDDTLFHAGFGIADRFMPKAQKLEPMLEIVADVLDKKAAEVARLRRRYRDSGRLGPLTAPPDAESRAASSDDTPADQPDDDKLLVGKLSLHFKKRRFLFDNRELELTTTELWVLTELASHANRPLSMTHLAEMIGTSRGKDIGASRVRGIIHALRQKLEPNPAHPRYLLTIRNGGYKLALDE